MSFILDALKKLEQKRQRGSVPDLMTVHMPESQKPRKRPAWPYLVLAALILNAGILMSWLRPWESGKINKSAEVMTEQKNKQAAKEPASIETTTSYSRQAAVKGPVVKSNFDEKRKREPMTQKPEHKSVDNQSAVSSSHHEQQVKKALDGKLRAAPLPSPSPAPDPGPSEIAKPEPQQGIPELGQLPRTVQAEIPALAVMGHVYSDSSVTRMVNINGDILREGDTASKNIKVEEITENGVVFNFNGLLFQVRAF